MRDEDEEFSICYGKSAAVRERATSGSQQIMGEVEAGVDMLLIERGWVDSSVTSVKVNKCFGFVFL